MTSRRAPPPPTAVDLLLDLQAAPPKRRAGGDGDGRAVLVVDRFAIARKFLMQRLEARGYRAHGAEHADDALAQARQQRFAIVFGELSLGPKTGPDGLALCREIKQLAHDPAPAFVLVAGQLGASDRVRGSLAGCDGYLIKPLDEAALVAVVKAVDPAFR